jgi:predicted metalloprotease
VTFRGGARLDPSQVEDRRGGGGLGGPVIAGGGGIGIIILVVALLMGADPAALLTGTQGAPIEGAPSAQECQTGADANRREDCRIVGFVNSIQQYWTDEFARRGSSYRPAKTVLFSDYVQAGCGMASAATGPFYCPQDEKVYLDISFFGQLQQQFGARGGPFAEAYVVAHEYGHHLQNQMGLLESRQSNRASIQVELMADCLAGVWARNAADTGFLEQPTDAEIAQALDAAAAVGDDRIQRQTQGYESPEAWTHGSSAQRQEWFRTGYATGNMDRCNTSSVR